MIFTLFIKSLFTDINCVSDIIKDNVIILKTYREKYIWFNLLNDKQKLLFKRKKLFL